MSFRPRLLLSVIVLWMTQLSAQSFEGVIEMKTKSDADTPSITYMVKDGNVRIEMETQRGTMVLLHMGKDGSNIVLMTQMQMYMEVPAAQPPEGDAPKPEITKTGKSQKILGYDADEIDVKGENFESKIWATKGLGQYVAPGMGGRDRNGFDWESMEQYKGYFPLQIVTTGKSGNESKFEVTKIEQKSLDASLFQIPPDYKKMDRPMMGRPRNER
ncbi:MAG TPA: DUF4412 domain-containing protein [Bacteroidota bacterium]|nr:DUF4412 domain-containing protein [Bacteroidota bacterium]